MEMLIHDKYFRDELEAMIKDEFGFGGHFCVSISDGAATGHNNGTSGHAGRCGCNHCTVAGEFKDLIPADYDLEKDPHMIAILGKPRTKKGTIAQVTVMPLSSNHV